MDRKLNAIALELCLRLQRGWGVRGWGRVSLGTGARGRGARVRRALMSTTDQGAAARGRSAARPICPGPPPVLRRQPQQAPQPLDRGAADRQPFRFPQLLGGMAVIDVAIAALQQLRGAPPHVGR
jgi:hypothetical protein